jgi:hypothetical protein
MKETILVDKADGASVIPSRCSLQQCPSMKEWVLGVLEEGH